MSNSDYGAIPLTLAESTSEALNTKLGVTTGFKPSEWPAAIASIPSGGSQPDPLTVCSYSKVWSSGNSGEETYTIPSDGLYLCICGTSYQGTAILTLPVGADVLYSGDVNAVRPCKYAIANLSEDDVVTMSNASGGWHGLTKVIFKLNGFTPASVPEIGCTDDDTDTYTFNNVGTNTFKFIVSGRCGGTMSDTVTNTGRYSIDEDVMVGETSYSEANVGFSNGGTYSSYGYDGGYGYHIAFTVNVTGSPRPPMSKMISLTPAMSSNSDDGFIARASSEFSSSYQAYMVFDRNSLSAWAPENGQVSNWVEIEMPVAQIADYFSITTRSDYYATEVTIQGSNDGTNYTTLGTITNMTAGSTYNLHLNSNVAYLIYRFVIDDLGLQEIYIGSLVPVEPATTEQVLTDGRISNRDYGTVNLDKNILGYDWAVVRVKKAGQTSDPALFNLSKLDGTNYIQYTFRDLAVNVTVQLSDSTLKCSDYGGSWDIIDADVSVFNGDLFDN